MLVKSLGLSTFAGGSLTVNYQAINTGFSDPVNRLTIVNNAKIPCYFSFDGINADEFLRAESERVINFINSPSENLHALKKGLIVYVKSSGASQGTIAVSGYSVNY